MLGAQNHRERKHAAEYLAQVVGGMVGRADY
jgi:hypothetical protein